MTDTHSGGDAGRWYVRPQLLVSPHVTALEPATGVRLEARRYLAGGLTTCEHSGSGRRQRTGPDLGPQAAAGSRLGHTLPRGCLLLLGCAQQWRLGWAPGQGRAGTRLSGQPGTWGLGGRSCGGPGRRPARAFPSEGRLLQRGAPAWAVPAQERGRASEMKLSAFASVVLLRCSFCSVAEVFKGLQDLLSCLCS